MARFSVPKLSLYSLLSVSYQPSHDLTSTQRSRYHQLYVVSPQLAALVRRCVLPVLFLELVGPHLRVSALASPADAVVVCEPLTPYLHLLPMLRYQPGQLHGHGWVGTGEVACG